MSNLIFPPFVEKGDKVIILSPSGKIEPDFIAGAKKRLNSWGLRVQVGRHARGSFASYAGTIRHRVADLQQALDDDEAKVILCSRGGYGAVHLMDKLDFGRFERHPKWLVGFSDITALHCYLQQQGFASIHGPMAKHLTLEPEDDPSTLKLKDLLFGKAFASRKLYSYTCNGHPLNHPGKAEGILRGGNLSVYYGLRGTRYDIPVPGTILFLEDVGERPHSVERMMYNLKLGGVLEQLSGLIIGQFTEYEDHGNLGKQLMGAIADIVREYRFPVCFDFSTGHIRDNYPLIEGAHVRLRVTKKEAKLTFDKPLPTATV